MIRLAATKETGLYFHRNESPAEEKSVYSVRKWLREGKEISGIKGRKAAAETRHLSWMR